MIDKVRKFSVNYSTYCKGDNYGIYLEIAKAALISIKNVVNQDKLKHHFSISENNDDQLFFINVDNSIKFCIFISEYEVLESNTAVNMEALMNKYDITEKELQGIYNSEPSLLTIPEPRIYHYGCQVRLSILDAVPDKWELAKEIITKISL